MFSASYEACPVGLVRAGPLGSVKGKIRESVSLVNAFRAGSACVTSRNETP